VNTVCKAIILFCFIGLISKPLQAQRIKLWSDTSKNVRRIGLPVAVYTPETHFGIGALGVMLWKSHHPEIKTRTSNAELLFLYTSRHQIIFIPRYTIFTRGEKFMLEGFGEELIDFRDNYYGVGDKTPSSNREIISYDVLGWENRVGHRIIKNKHLFAGLETRIIRYFNIKTEPGSLLKSEMTSGYQGSTSIGFGPSMTWDERDNVVNPSKGFYWDMRYSFYSKDIGSTNEYHRVIIDFRKYFLLNSAKHRILAFQVFNNFVKGDAPFKELAELGGPRVLRGYYRGRFRDNYLSAFQAEYRMPLYKRLGMVAFAGVAKVYNPESVNLEGLHTSWGAGLRYTINKKERLNLRLDWGYGDRDRPGYFYLGFAESF
jgi:outer membrane protein assembly factor BamA